ncbi:MAG TPA: hypothetical protein ENL20_11805 [Candidatus Cloacimonetes bacterium]|nr:hypothetical protein [Candidatus Cloacimonadota bacterium]
MKTTKYIDTITVERIKWIQIVRNDFNILISSLLIHINNTDYLKELINEMIRKDHTEQLVGVYRDRTDEDIQEYSELKSDIEDVESAFNKVMTRSEIVNKALLMKLKMKMNPKDDIEIIDYLDKIVNYFSDYSKEINKFDIDLKSIIDKVQELLKREWDKVKTEVRKK